MDNLFQQFGNLIDPSTTLGAFVISIFASFIGGFFTGKKVKNIQKSHEVHGDMYQNPKIYKR
jgi:hypothetical protein